MPQTKAQKAGYAAAERERKAGKGQNSGAKNRRPSGFGFDPSVGF